MPEDDLELVYLTLEDALELYAAIVGGTVERAASVLRSGSALEGALARPASYAHYQDVDLALQAAVLAHGIAESQAFVDGNKRLALVSMLTFLEANGYRIDATDPELAGWIIDLSGGPHARAARRSGTSAPRPSSTGLTAASCCLFQKQTTLRRVPGGYTRPSTCGYARTSAACEKHGFAGRSCTSMPADDREYGAMVRRGSTVRVRQRASRKYLQIGTSSVVSPPNTRTHSGHISGTRDAARRFATPSDTVFGGRHGRVHRRFSCKEGTFDVWTFVV